MQTLKSLYLIRHGETQWSITGQHTSRSEVALTPHGEDQARRLGDRLRATTFDHVLVSPRLRARQTEAIANLGLQPLIDDDLREWDYGDYEGRTTADILQESPAWDLWSDGCPNGESPEAVARRCDRLLTRLRTLSGTIALFSHGHISCALATRWIGLPIVNGRHFVLDPATISVLGFPDHHDDVPAIKSWNAS